MQVICIKVNKNGKYATPTNTFKKGETYNLQSHEAARLVGLGVVEYTSEAEKLIEATADLRAQRKKEAEKAE